MNQDISKIESQFKEEMNEALECINADGQVIRVEIDNVNKEVKFIFELSYIDNKPTWIYY